MPISGTDIRLMKGVPFTNDYKDTRYFTNATDQYNYFNSRPQTHTMDQANFQRIEGYQFIKVDKSVDDLFGTNYVMFRNSHYSNKWFYAFVTRVEYQQRNTTYVYFELDVLQTWFQSLTFKPSMVVREHRKLWNSDGTPVVNTQEEGLAYGSEYTKTQIIHKADPVLFMVVATKESVLDGRTINERQRIGVPTPLFYYVVPVVATDQRVPYVQVNGTTVANHGDFLQYLAQSDSFVDNVVSIYLTESIGVPFNAEVVKPEGSYLNVTLDSNRYQLLEGSMEGITVKFMEMREIFRFTSEQVEVTNDIYSQFETDTPITESKLLNYPYSIIELDDLRGNRMTIKPEQLVGKKLLLYRRGSLGTSSYVNYAIQNYNQDWDTSEGTMQHSLAVSNPNDIPILTDQLAAYLQGNRNSLQNRKAQDYARTSFNTLDAGARMVTSHTSPQGTTTGFIRHSIDLARGAVDGILTAKGYQAKVEDIDNIPPSLSNMGMNTSFDFGYQLHGVRIIFKQIKPEYVKTLEGFFHKYGYATNELKVPNLKTRKHFNFVQTIDATITGDVNTDILNEVKQIFNDGITLWHVNDVGNYNYTNEVV